MLGFKDIFLNNIKKLSQSVKERFDRIYKYWETVGKLVPPKEMTSWIQTQFGELCGVVKQDFIKITNIVTYEGSVFNDLRTKRPIVFDGNFERVLQDIENTKNGAFAHPKISTPADTFGRVRGKYSITASNIAKYDGLHGLVIYSEHNPLLFSRRRVRDYFAVAKKWFIKAHKSNLKALYPMYTWNCLWKAGASMIHGHAQLVLTEGQAYAKVESLRIATHNYQERYKSNYFEDVYYIHKKLGLAFERDDIRIISKLTPIKDKELLLISNKFDDNLATVVSDVLTTLKEKMAVASFNLSIILPPMEETAEVWDHMPIIVRIVDRGKLTTQTADVGVMELYAQSIIETSPYEVYKELKSALLK